MTDFLKIAKSIVVHFAHICAYGVETVKWWHISCGARRDPILVHTVQLKSIIKAHSSGRLVSTLRKQS